MTPGTGLYMSLDQQRPEDMLSILVSSLGSKPSLRKGEDRYQYLIQTWQSGDQNGQIGNINPAAFF